MLGGAQTQPKFTPLRQAKTFGYLNSPMVDQPLGYKSLFSLNLGPYRQIVDTLWT